MYVDSAEDGVKLPGEWGLQNVTLTLTENSSSGAIAFTATTTTNAAANYAFTGLQPGDTCTIRETQPGNYRLTTATMGNFLSASGGSLARIPRPLAASVIDANDNNNVNILSVVLPSATGSFAPNGSDDYSGVNFNFGELPMTPIGGSRMPLSPGVPASCGHRAQRKPLGRSGACRAGTTASLPVRGRRSRLDGHGGEPVCRGL